MSSALERFKKSKYKFKHKAKLVIKSDELTDTKQALISTLKNGGRKSNAGRKPNPFKTKVMRVPEKLIPEIERLILKYYNSFK